MKNKLLKVTVSAIDTLAEGVKAFTLRRSDGRPLPLFTAGSHIDLHLPDGEIRQYSLCNNPEDEDRYVIAVLREEDGRGGSVYLHDQLGEGTELAISRPRNLFPLHEEAGEHLLIAGGIGITPLIAMIHRLTALQAKFRLVYCAASPEKAAFLELLKSEALKNRVTLHYDAGDPARAFDLQALLREVIDDCHIYCCGPQGMMAAVKEAASHWPANSVHFEHFTPDETLLAGPRQAFQVTIASSGQVIDVPADKSILQALEEQGIEVESSCGEGICGTCITGLLAGEADHRDAVLSDEEKTANSHIALCCSRSKSASLTLDL